MSIEAPKQALEALECMKMCDEVYCDYGMASYTARTARINKRYIKNTSELNNGY